MKVETVVSVTKDFITHFAAYGFSLHDSEPLIPRDDPTLAFTNSTIVPLKSYLKDGFAPPGFMLVQSCLRLRNLATDTYSDQFTSFFHMASILVHSTLPYNELQYSVSMYMTEALGFETIEIHYDGHTESLAQGWSSNFIPVNGQKEPSFYAWKYGIPGVGGRGITFLVNTPHGARELGNLVELRSEDRVIGYEFGLGIESCIGIQQSLPDNYAVLQETILDRKLLDLTIAAGVAHQAMQDESRVVPNTTKSSIRKILHELAHYIFEKNESNVDYLNQMKWVQFEVSPKAVQALTNAITHKLLAIGTAERMLSKYRAYIEYMGTNGKNEAWRKKKLDEYIYKNNLERITRQPRKHL